MEDYEYIPDIYYTDYSIKIGLLLLIAFIYITIRYHVPMYFFFNFGLHHEIIYWHHWFLLLGYTMLSQFSCTLMKSTIKPFMLHTFWNYRFVKKLSNFYIISNIFYKFIIWHNFLLQMWLIHKQQCQFFLDMFVIDTITSMYIIIYLQSDKKLRIDVSETLLKYGDTDSENSNVYRKL